ncbi:MAG TPA: inositol-3-phosphate synthase [bacterium]|nr:inositol-3-phosphate synthase [bacterium]
MRNEIRIAIAGLGNCASALVQGIYYYKDVKKGDDLIPGLMYNLVGKYRPKDIKVVAAFDVDKRKVGKDVSKAIFALPNCVKTFYTNIPNLSTKVKMGPVLDGVSPHFKEYSRDKGFVVSKEKPVNIAKELKKSGAQILITLLPVGSEKAIRFYANEALKANCALVNCIPVFIASDKKWSDKFKKKGLPVIGDDIKSQIGATIIHRVLANLFSNRGVHILKSYQLNVGGNTDFINLIAKERGKSKKISKTESVQSQLSKRLSYDDLHIAPSDYVPWLKDTKLAFIRLEGRQFGDLPLELEIRLQVNDSPNSAGCIIEAVRLAKIALDRKIAGPLISASAYFMKHPPQQFVDEKAREMVEEFINGKRKV